MKTVIAVNVCYLQSISNDICPKCGGELVKYIFCFSCNFSDEDDETSTDWDDGYSDSSDLYSYDDEYYDSMVNNGVEICLKCTFWSASHYGANHGMVCRKCRISDGPDDSCE